MTNTSREVAAASGAMARLLPWVVALIGACSSGCQNADDDPAASAGGGQGGVEGEGGGSAGGGEGGAAGGGGGAAGGGQGGAGGEGSPALPEPAWRPTGQRVTWNNVSFLVPPGMTGTDATDRFELLDPGDDIGTNACAITIYPPMAAGDGDLAQQAGDIMGQAYEPLGYQVLDDNYGTDLLAHRTYGRSAGGWEYVELRAELRRDEPSAERGHVLLVKVGGSVVPFIGYSPNASGCTQLDHDFTTGIVGELRWRQLYFSLEFPSLVADPAPAPSVVGRWTLFQGPSGQQYVFAENGRYQFWGALTQSEPVEVTNQFVGDGAYGVKGDVLGLFPNGQEPSSSLFRVFEQHAVSPSGEVSVTTKLGLMKADVAGPFEVPLSLE